MILRFKHLNSLLTQDDKLATHDKVMVEVLGYKKSRIPIIKTIKFIKAFREADKILRKAVQIDPKKLGLPKYANFLLPPSIDEIPFIARIELELAFQNLGQSDDVVNEIGNIVSIVSFSTTTGLNFDSETKRFALFKAGVMHDSIESVMGAFNWIKKGYKESNEFWSAKFSNVNTTDPDYIQAGGHLMEAFNVNRTIKGICEDYNVSYEEAWQMPYVVVQTNILEAATGAMIQNRMTDIKQKRMEMQRTNKGH